ncbi:MAG: Gfo/Idh/MocA family oxidoreductase [Provencibacterium sp.]|jgi:predicted dehydrogenase|nr:Gfo/Idh/MocA family oxidoreductase [Provencibacterium sp.]
MEKVKTVLVGLGGYGGHHMRLLRETIDPSSFSLQGIVDPFAKSAEQYAYVQEQGIPVYDTLEEFYKQKSAQLAIIASPIPLHREQSICAMEHGSHVLCEKPIASTVQDALVMEEAAGRLGKKLGIGFQWSFSTTMRTLKKDILDGVYGRPVMLKTLISWQRFDDYYQNGWKGHVRDGKGNWVLDSVTSNATAHYLHNLFFLMGDRPDTAAAPVDMRAGLYRAKQIESFDTCFLTGAFPNGGRFCYIATHAAEVEQDPCFCYQFEKGTVVMDVKTQHVTATLEDGRTIDYGYPQGTASLAEKDTLMLRAAVSDEQPPCTIKTALPCLQVCNALFDQCDIRSFPGELVFRTENPGGTFVKGLFEGICACYEQAALPDELHLSWAQPSQPVDIGGYTRFEGKKFQD